MKTKILTAAVLAVLAIQLVPYGRNHANPADASEPTWDRPETRETFFRVCADCHSHQTRWPWYSNIAPASWLVQRDVTEGREHFNASMWGINKKNHGDEAAEKLTEGEMPLWFYVALHPEAKLSADEKKSLSEGLTATFGKSEGHGDHHEHDEDE